MIESQIIQGECIEELKKIPNGVVQLVITSPPYYSLRRYTDDVREIGREETWQDYVKKMVEVFHECKRVLTDTGSFYLNIGDMYVSGGGQRKRQDRMVTPNWQPEYGKSATDDNMEDGCRLGMPWRVAFALIDDGWTLRNDIALVKMQALPNSVMSRYSNKWEYMMFLTKQPSGYYFNAEAVLEPPLSEGMQKITSRESIRIKKANKYEDESKLGSRARVYGGLKDLVMKQAAGGKGALCGDWWIYNPALTKDSHTAAYSEDLCMRPILASSRPGDFVLDPFSGTGTTAAAAKKMGRGYIGIELGVDNAEKSRRRLASIQEPLIVEV